MIKTLGLVGYGHFGAFLHILAQRLLPDVTLKIHSRGRDGDGGLFVSLEEASACDAVVLAVPISEYEPVLQAMTAHLRPDTVIVDVATVKEYTAGLIRSIAPHHRFISMHPMFGPESYAKRGGDISGFRIVVTERNIEPELWNSVRNRLTELEFSIVEKSADAHDKDLAETLFLTHYVGQVIARGGFERTNIDTVSFGYLMDAVDSVRHDTQLFREVCRYNAHCRHVVQRFDASERQVKAQLLELTEPGAPSAD